MHLELFLHVAKEGLLLALLLSLPALAAALAVGLVVSIMQAATQVQEPTVSATPKIAAVTVTLVLTALWMLGKLASFAEGSFGFIETVGLGG